MDIKLAKRLQQLTPSSTLAISTKAKQLAAEGYDVIDLGLGEPDFPTPVHVLEAAMEAMQRGHTKYTPAAGIPELKKAIIQKLRFDHGLYYDQNQIIVGAGAKQLLYNLFQAILDPEDEVIIPSPYWVSYPEQVKLADGIPVVIEGKEENGFKVTAEQIRQAITNKTKAIILNSPSNPTGVVYDREELQSIAEVAIQASLWIVSDEIYEKFVYDGTHTSIASISSKAYEHTILINGLSKTYSMTGWRIGYAAGNVQVIKAMTDLSSQIISNPTSISQYAAIAALEGNQDYVLNMKQQFQQRRDEIYKLIQNIPGFSCALPKGAFYFYINVAGAMEESQYNDVDQWVNDLLTQQKVAVVPGTGFGSRQHIRISYATSMERLREGMARIQDFVLKKQKV